MREPNQLDWKQKNGIGFQYASFISLCFYEYFYCKNEYVTEALCTIVIFNDLLAIGVNNK